MIGHAKNFKLGRGSVEFRHLGRAGYRHHGWGNKWSIFTGTWEGMPYWHRFFVVGTLMISFYGAYRP